MLINNYLHWAMANLTFVMFLLATVVALLHKIARPRISTSEIVYRWYMFFPVGVACLYIYLMHAFYPIYTAALFGWLNSPFQFEVATANLAFGLLAILSFKASFGFRLATVIGSTCWLWGKGLLFFQLMQLQHNMAFSNASSKVLLDFLVPVILLLCLWSLKKQERC